MKKILAGLLFFLVALGAEAPAFSEGLDFCSLLESDLLIHDWTLKLKMPREFRCGFMTSETLTDLDLPNPAALGQGRRNIELKELKPFLGAEFMGKGKWNLSLIIGRGIQLNLGASW